MTLTKREFNALLRKGIEIKDNWNIGGVDTPQWGICKREFHFSDGLKLTIWGGYTHPKDEPRLTRTLAPMPWWADVWMNFEVLDTKGRKLYPHEVLDMVKEMLPADLFTSFGL